MRLWLGVVVVLGCGSSSGKLSTPGESGKEKPSQQRQARPASAGAQGSAGKRVAAEESQAEHSPESGEPEPEAESELGLWT